MCKKSKTELFIWLERGDHLLSYGAKIISYTCFNVIITKNANARNSRSKISISKLDIVLGYHH